ncbi:MAG: HesA/MoeB/ThiF family protein [Promethearchaeota archaeon]|nr:MAG: HesA/MoeB/ThiF family protein [Candidatus Lokiarchaeota archaeon]
MLNEKQIERYSRQIVLKEVGGKGQKKLLNSKISLVGVGGLGSPAALYLAAAGIGTLRIIDFDFVDLSNLQRQVLHFTQDITKLKTESAYDKLHELNPDINIELVNERIDPINAEDLIKGSDYVIDGSDNVQTKMLINDLCIKLGIPFTIAGVLRFHGQILTVIPEEKTTCYRCVFGDVKTLPSSMSCSQAGVMGYLPGIFGCIEANESIKYLLNLGNLIVNRMLFIDLLEYHFNFIEIKRDENCLACGKNPVDLIKTVNYQMDDRCYD